MCIDVVTMGLNISGDNRLNFSFAAIVENDAAWRSFTSNRSLTKFDAQSRGTHERFRAVDMRAKRLRRCPIGSLQHFGRRCQVDELQRIQRRMSSGEGPLEHKLAFAYYLY